MKRFLSAVLCIAVICSMLAPVSAQEQQSEKLSLLTDLGLIEKYEPEADATREMMMAFVDTLCGAGAYRRYLEDKDKSQPILYGQVLMILVDVTGYSVLLDVYGYDKSSNESYLSIAMKAGITKSRSAEFTEPVKVKDYADMIYNALTQVNLLEYSSYSGAGEYRVNRKNTALNTILELSYRDGIVTGTNTTSLNGDEEGVAGEIAVDGKWYKLDIDRDMLQYLGSTVRIYFNEDERRVYSIAPRDNKNEIITVDSVDILTERVSRQSVSYQKDGERVKNISIDSRADFVYNRRLLQAYTEEHLQLSDCVYRFIDNDLDGKADVIIADRYTAFMADTIVEHNSRIIDTKSRVYDLEEYFDDGYKIYDAQGRAVTLDDIGGYNIISYQQSNDGEYTNFVISTQKASGTLEETNREDGYMTLSGTQYRCLEQYYSNPDDYETVRVGDEVEVFFDFRGYIADIKQVSGAMKAGYVLGGYRSDNGGYVLRLLQEDGKIEPNELADTVTVDGKRRAADAIEECTVLFDGARPAEQLILYKKSAAGQITLIDTAEDAHGIGSNDNEGFTLDYDYEQASTLRAISLNGQTVLGSKYLPNSDTKVFGISSDREQCYVQSGTAIATLTSIKLKLFNVGSDYVPQYIVLNANASVGAWVDVWNKPYVVDRVRQVYDEEKEEARYQLEYYDGDGKKYTSFISDETLIPPNGNAMSGDSRFRKVMIKDVPRGTVIQINEDKNGINSYSIQSMPMSDNSEIIFEKASSVGGTDYGVNEYMFNGSSLCSYGKVIKRLSGGVIINNHLPTDVEAAKGGVFPMDNWNRAIPLAAADTVWFYDKSTGELEKGTASEILEGDMIFMHRRATSIMMTIVYR